MEGLSSCIHGSPFSLVLFGDRYSSLLSRGLSSIMLISAELKIKKLSFTKTSENGYDETEEQGRSRSGRSTRLPDEVFLSILNRMDDLKFLCQCSLVSKRFASTIYCIQSVSLTLPSTEKHSTVTAKDIYILYHQILDVTSEEEIPGLIRSSSIQMLKFSLFLQNFREIKSIYLEFICVRALSGSSLLTWKAKYRNSEDGVESLVSLVASSARKTNENELDEEPEDDHNPFCFSMCHIIDCAFLPVQCCREWLLVLCLLVKCHCSLKSVVITDTEKQGKLALRGEQLVEWRKNLLCVLDYFQPQTPSVCWLRELRLPLSGYLLKGVCFLVIRCMPELDLSLEHDDVMTWEYKGGEKVLCEAVSEIFTKYGDLFFRFLELPTFLPPDARI